MNFWTLIGLISRLWSAIEWVIGAITYAQYQARLSKIDENVKKAKAGKFEDRLEGGRELEEAFNRHVNK